MADDKKIIFSMVGVSKTIQQNQKQVLKNIYLSFFYGAKIGIIGLNGSGKSTLMKIIAGLDQQYQGEVVFSPGYSVGYLPQEPHLDDDKTVIEIVKEGVQEVVDALAEYEEINQKFGLPEYYEDSDKMNELFVRQGELQDIIDSTDAWNLESKLERAMDALRCPPADQVVDVLSGGERRRVALCRLLLQKPDILLLDEPTNHLDAETVAWLEKHLHDYPGTVIAVTHDRYFLDEVAGWILELDRGEGYPFKGNYSSWLEQKNQRMSLESKHESERQKEIQRELEWIHMGAKGRQAKHKEHITRYNELMSQGSKQQLKDTQISIPAGPRLGGQVIDFEGVSKSFGDKLLFENLDLHIPAGAIVGIVGPNGAGKTTLFKMIVDAAGKAGGEKPDAGEIKIGKTVKLVYVDQMRSGLDENKTVYETLGGGADIVKLGAVDEKGRPLEGGVREVNAHAYCGWFNFVGPDQNKKVSVLSGGEKNRLNLGMMLKEAGNVLLFDEPTNDLDVQTVRALEEALEDFAGCAMVVSHDRWFLDRVCTHILAFENNSEVRYFEGNWSEYAEWKKEQFGEDASVPKRVQYRKLSR